MKRYAVVYITNKESLFMVKKYGGFVAVLRDGKFIRHTLFMSKKRAEKMVVDRGDDSKFFQVWEEDDVKRLAIKKALS